MNPAIPHLHQKTDTQLIELALNLHAETYDEPLRELIKISAPEAPTSLGRFVLTYLLTKILAERLAAYSPYISNENREKYHHKFVDLG